MAFPNASITDIIATTIDKRRKKIRDNVRKNNALLEYLEKEGNSEEFGGGATIIEEINFAENGNAQWYSGYDQIAVTAQDVLSGAQYNIKQAACAVLISGLEQLQNSGEEAFIDLMNARIKTAEATMANLICGALYSDGTGFGGKQLTGLLAAVSITPTTGVYGGIDPAVFPFWQNQLQAAGPMSAATIQQQMNLLWIACARGRNKTKLILFDNNLWSIFLQSLQAIQRFSDVKTGELGFVTQKFMGADVIVDGGIGGFCPANTGYFLNPEYLHYRPHKDRNMVSLSPNRRVSMNQDSEAEILAFAGNMTCSGRRFQGVLKGY